MAATSAMTSAAAAVVLILSASMPATAQTFSCASATAHESRLIAELNAHDCDNEYGAGKATCRQIFRAVVQAERTRDRACALGYRPRTPGGFFNNLLKPGAGFVLGGW